MNQEAFGTELISLMQKYKDAKEMDRISDYLYIQIHALINAYNFNLLQTFKTYHKFMVKELTPQEQELFDEIKKESEEKQQ